MSVIFCMQRKSSALHAGLDHLATVVGTCDAERTNLVIHKVPNVTRISCVGLARTAIVGIPVRTSVGAMVKHLK